jgi:hypothetical protein
VLESGQPYQVINHSPQAIAASWYLAVAFINAARRNSNAYPTAAAEAEALLFGKPTTLQYIPKFSEVYVFKPQQQQSQQQQQQPQQQQQQHVSAGREPQYSDLHGGKLQMA